MDISRIFQDLGVDAIIGTQLMNMLELSSDELIDSQRFSRFRHIINFLKDYSEDTQRLLINKSVRSKAVDKLNHFFEYTNLLKQKQDYELMLGNLKKEQSVLNDDIPINDLQIKIDDISGRLSNTLEEITIYEK